MVKIKCNKLKERFSSSILLLDQEIKFLGSKLIDKVYITAILYAT